MDNISLDKFQKVIFEIQDILFKKGTKDEAISHLESNGITISALLQTFITHENEKIIELIITLLDLLKSFPSFTETLLTFILTFLQSNINTLAKVETVQAKKYLLLTIKQNISHFITQTNILTELFKTYFTDENAGVYTQTLDLFIHIYKNKEHNLIFNKDKHCIENILTHFNAIANSTDSIYIIRKLEIVLVSLCFDNELRDVLSIELEVICNDFMSYDTLTQLAFLETLESNITKESVLMLCKPNKCFFNGMIMEMNELSVRKLLYTFSKFYARDILNEDIKLIKNTLALSFQHYEDHKENIDFICPILSNVFINPKIFDFLLEPSNNTQFDFMNNTIDIIVDNYLLYDPHIKQNVLEVLANVFMYNEQYSTKQDEFIMKLLSKFNHAKTNNDVLISEFVERIYNDFKKHDLPDYEYIFLLCVRGMISNPKMSKIVLSHFEFVLYLLNRRDKPKEVCEVKFNIINDIVTKSNLTQLMSQEFENQFISYIQKGPF